MEHPLPYFNDQQQEMPNLDTEMQSKNLFTDPEFFIRRGFLESPMVGCELLYHRYYQNLCSYAVKLVLSKEIAEDIVADIFLTFWNKAHYEQIHTGYAAYFFRAVRNRCYSHLKKDINQNHIPDALEDDSLVEQDTPESIMLFHDLSQRLDEEIQALPSQCRRAFVLNRYEDKPYQEIAEELNISKKAVEHLISRALKKLRTQLLSISL